MGDLKRLEVKYVRDGAKALYDKKDECYICGSSELLQMHHFHSMTLLWEKWKKDNTIVIESSQQILDIRDDFITEYHDEIYKHVVTLCKHHHMDKLHKVYGKVPTLATAAKQQRWCDIRREKEYPK
tara:strand:- start:2241 stop:2618 length:378 start_codon:yes stop_codon:yes gene_type:complete